MGRGKKGKKIMFNVFVAILGSLTLSSSSAMSVLSSTDKTEVIANEAQVIFEGEQDKTLFMVFDTFPQPKFIKSGNSGLGSIEQLFVYSANLGQTPVWEYTKQENFFPAGYFIEVEWNWGKETQYHLNPFYDHTRYYAYYSETSKSVSQMGLAEGRQYTYEIMNRIWVSGLAKSRFIIGTGTTYYKKGNDYILEFLVRLYVETTLSFSGAQIELSLGNSIAFSN